uniref:Uncharacterized protein n=1 Tax=Hyaloperonospora arabidopsidis (strain Emoy2) TaxID=559515 RepID=M4BTB1_HYAAE
MVLSCCRLIAAAMDILRACNRDVCVYHRSHFAGCLATHRRRRRRFGHCDLSAGNSDIAGVARELQT